MVKRDREDAEVEALAMANCLMLLSRVGDSAGSPPWPANRGSRPGERMFACKTCNREFSSFQALGGHRASHKKPKVISGDLFHLGRVGGSSPAKPKTHACLICGLEFPIGQALGGHMRRHRAAMAESLAAVAAATKPVPVLKKSNSKRVMCLDLNSSLTEDNLTLRLGKVAPSLVLDLVL
ncbi:zinc finger protein ZAT8-like [Syzygium oleosum]|uniref:zinc finger protein ZAT8-like n=1 Tax=Syzygium oleosum TaxID=219896 RepID=UPI0011D289D9|nr:zinc finger protein ZAT8-like [Syzygium oleosum]